MTQPQSFSEAVAELRKAMFELSRAFCCALDWHRWAPMSRELNPLTTKTEMCVDCGRVR